MKLLIISVSIFLLNELHANDSGRNEHVDKRPYTVNELQNLKSTNSPTICSYGNLEYSLYQSGNSLEGVKQQDQDGLSTCYANTASLILKSYNPSLPVPSYLHLASYNVPNKDEEYDFDFGRACTVLNKWKEENSPLCSTEILENQPNEVQDKILRTLYDVYNKHQYTPEQVLALLDTYSDFLQKYPYVPHGKCQEKLSSLNFDDFYESKLLSLFEEITFLPKEGAEITPEDEKFAKDCSGRFVDTFNQLGQIETKVEKYLDGGTYTYYSLNQQFKKNEGQKLKNFFQSKKHPSNVSYFESIVQLLDASKNYNGTYEKVIGDNVAAKQYVAFLDKMALEGNSAVLLPSLTALMGSDQQLKNCLERSNFNQESYSPLMFNSLLAQCQDKDLKQWRRNYSEKFNECNEVDKEVFSAFNSLLSLDQNVEDIKNFIAQSDKNILKQIINNNCKDYHQYSSPPSSCNFQETPPDLGVISDASEWSVYKTFIDDLERFIKKNGLKTMVNLEAYLTGIANKLNASKSNSQVEAYRNMLRTIYDSFPKDSDLKSFSIEKFKSMGLGYAKKMKQQQIGQGLGIVNKLKSGKALGLSTCTELFSESEKGKFNNCGKHSVTATGFKCEGGRLKIELSNSWGIGCQPDDKSKELFECQKDQDGLTNGRAWVDFNYLSDLGLGVSSF